MSGEKTIKAKNIMYEQQMEHLPTKDIDTLVSVIEKKLNYKKYALIIHDKDHDEKGNLVKPHVQAMISLENNCSLNSVANKLGDKPQQLTAWRGDSNNGYAYLIHATTDAQNKYQYDPKDVIASKGFDYVAEMEKISAQIKAKKKAKATNNIDGLLDSLYVGAITKKEVEEMLSGSQYAKAKRQIEDVWAKYLIKKAEEWRKAMKEQNKNVQVIWIDGTAGVGKTSLAKECARKHGDEYFISGSSKDVFQNYAGQHIAIIDEFRPHTIPYHDLLRITDPFGMEDEVNAPSRFRDKAIACEVIIITSPYSAFDFYMESFRGQDPKQIIDSFEQLNRRIALNIHMDSDYIFARKFNPTFKQYDVIKGTKKKNPYSSKKRPAPSVNAVALYDEMLG